MTELYHYGIKGQKWGVRRYRKKDGSLTRLGKKHRNAALKGLEQGRDEYASKAKQYKSYADSNKNAINELKGINPEQTKWAKKALNDARKEAGRAYIQNLYNSKLYDAYHKAYTEDRIKVGEDYITTKLKTGRVELSDSGRVKESQIRDNVNTAFKKQYAKEIKDFT